ncbi:MAG: hypothetical protein MUE60_08870 [Candidatus Eisenbacteria bacterium]|jgi:HD-GYP domain-containing protein (c-di-GMP phosphodiesterase class II)|nr:hypothetical protein [Candidatus Eisenbacteria bacterium]
MSPPGSPAVGSVDDLLRSLNSALRVAQLYPRGHQSIATGLARAEEELTMLLRRRTAVHLGVLGEEIVFDDGDSYRASSAASYLLRVLQGHGVDRVSFSQGCCVADLSELVDILQRTPEEVTEGGGVQRVLHARGVRTITLERLTPTPLQAKDDMAPAIRPATATRDRSNLIVQARTGLDGIIESVESHRPIPSDPARSYVYELTQALVEGDSPLLSLALMEGHEDRWLTRLVRVTALAVGHGRRLGLGIEEVQALGTASFLYDVGLLALGLTRDSALENQQIYQSHPVEGARLLLASKNVDRLSVVVAFEHHMLHDLSGYPCVPGKRLVHPMAELVGLADEFVDLVSERAGRPALRSDQAILRLSKDAGRAYDARLFAAFVATVGVFAPGTFVDLSDGRWALVVTNNPRHVLRPGVRIIADDSGRVLDRPSHLDLAASGAAISIIGAFDPRERGIEPGPFLRSLVGGA